jgi:hypothetical protein
MKIGIAFVTAFALTALFSLRGTLAYAEPSIAGEWSERVQIMYLDESRSVVRRKVRVWNPEPEKNLDFIWEPAAAGSLAADGTINGRGKLVWRVRGSADYDPSTVYSTYSGDMKDGRPNGEGRLDIRSGEIFSGAFVDGLLTGKGFHVDASGNRYEGDFVAGKAHGEGRLAQITGEIYTGSFANGQKHGKGQTRLAGGSAYVSQWSMGKELDRPRIFADATLGGLLKTQSGGGDAGKVEISVAVEPRMTEQAEQDGGVAYQQLVRDEDIAIYPLDEQMNNLWNGTGEITTNSAYVFEDRDWEYAPAFAEIGINTADGSRVKLDKLELQVASSEAYRKPMLSLMQHVGCVGFRPSFSIKNDGWGEARDMTMNIQFTGQEPGGTASRAFSRPLGTFDQGLDVAITDVLDEAGVDTAKLENNRYSCQSMDSINVCRSQVFNDVGFGEIADYVWGEDKLYTTATGTLDYNWSDDGGNVYKASEPFRIDISMAIIETPLEAECGAGFGGSPEALRYQDVRFPVGQKDYTIDMPVRGNKNISSYVARLKMQSEPAMSSFHQFAVAASFADGSVKKSKPVSFFFLRPRLSGFSSAMTPPACYLPEGTYGC